MFAMRTRFRWRRPGTAAVCALTCALGLTACGGFDSAASGEHLIKDYVKKFGQNKVTVKSVSCPGGVKQKTGGTYDCKVVLHDTTTNSDHSGTITIHMIAGDKVEITGSQDLHFQ
jgi:hypothetical protein